MQPGTNTTEEPVDGSGDGGGYEPPRQGCRADDVVTCPEDNSVRICEVQLCDGHRDCPLGYDEFNCTVGRIHCFLKGVWRFENAKERSGCYILYFTFLTSFFGYYCVVIFSYFLFYF